LPYTPYIAESDSDYDPKHPAYTRDPRPYFPYDPTIRPDDVDYDPRYPMKTRAPRDPRPVPHYDPIIHPSDSDYDSRQPYLTRSPDDARAYPIRDPDVQLVEKCQSTDINDDNGVTGKSTSDEPVFALAIPSMVNKSEDPEKHRR